MKVAILTSGFFPVIDGVTITVFNRVQRLSQRGHQVLLLCPDYSATAAIYPDWQKYVGEILPGVTVTPLASSPFMGLEFDRNVTKTAYPQLLDALAQFQPDIIHVDEPERLQLGFDKIPAVDFAKHYSTACVSFLHTNFIEYLEDYFALPALIIRGMQFISKRIVARIYNAYGATLISSPTTYQKAIQMGIKNAIQAELLGVNLAQFDPQLKSADFFAHHYNIPDLDPPDPRVKLLFLGRLTPDKGWTFALTAFSQIARSAQHQTLLSQIALVIAGDGSMQTEIAQAFSTLPLTVHFLGRIAPNAVPTLLLHSDIHITTSEKETKGLTVLEAFAAGVPVLAPAAGGVIDTIESGQTGFLYQPRNWQDFAAKLQSLVENPQLRQRMGQTAQAHATNYDWDTAVDRLLNLWQQQIERQQGAPVPHKQ
ncbi:MAG: glycosyltransferase [Elainella sp. C42_A2020_010]|nr:glycosyltransferase [Elainella sp. C42_A2020_010]